MRIAVLLSAGRHPVSGAPVLPRLEAQAIRLAVGLGAAGEVLASMPARMPPRWPTGWARG